MAHAPLHRLLAAAYARVRHALVVRHALRAAAALCVLVAVAVLLVAPFPFAEGVAFARTLLAALAALGCLGVVLARLARATPRFDAWLEAVEARFPEVRSWLRNALDLERAPSPHTSESLAAALRDETARRLHGVPLGALAPRLEPRRPALAIAGATAALVLAALLAPARVERSWATLWDPASAAPPVRLAVEPGSVRIAPGAALAVRARVWGTPAAPRIERDGGPAVPAVDEGRTADGARAWRFDLAMLTREQTYRVRAARAASPRYRITLAGEPAPVSFEIEYHAPAYARLPVQHGTATRGDLTALEGSRAIVTVTFDRDLRTLEATSPGVAAATWTALTPRRWRGTVPVARAGPWNLRAVAEGGETRLAYRVTPLEDAPPVITVVVPEGDVDLPAGQRVPLEVVAQDDLGLSELALEHHKTPEAPWQRVPLERFGAAPREALVRALWDASGLGLLPGESATFRLVLWDDNRVRGRQRAESPAFTLRFPSLADLYDHLEDRQGGVQSALEKVTEEARDLQRTLERLARQSQQQERAAPQSASSFERQSEVRSALERQQELTQRVTEAAGELRKSLEEAAERQAFNENLMRRLRELADLMNQIQSPEFREAVQRLQRAMEQMDRRAAEQALPPWRDASRELMANLERTLELLKQLRAEERLAALARRAEELAERQEALNREHAEAGPRAAEEREARAKQLAAEQQSAAERSRELAKETRETGQEMQEPQDREAMDEAAQTMESEAAPEQQEAAEAQGRQQRQRAQASGERAARSLRSAASRLQNLASEQQQRREGADLAAVRRAAQDLVSLQREVEGNLESAPSSPSRADRQTDLSEGVGRVADSLYTLARRSPFITPRLGESLGRAMQSLSRSGREMASGNRSRGEQSGREGGEALNEAVRELRMTESSMCQQPGQGQGGSRSMAQRMGELGEQQSQVNQRSRSLAQRLSEQMRLSAGDQEEMRRMAEEQQRIREQLEQIERDDERERRLLGRLDAARREMQEVEEALRSGPPGADLEQKQNRILSRLLDASRSVNRRDFDPERESRPGEEVARSSPAPLPADLLGQTDRLRSGLLKAEADRFPAQYRPYIEAYLRSLNEARR